MKTYNPTDYADLAATLKNFDLGSWIDAWQTAYDATEAAKAQPIDFKSVFARVIVHEPSFLTGLDAFWAEADLADLKLWARVHMILGFASSLSRDFDTTNFDFYGKVPVSYTHLDVYKRQILRSSMYSVNEASLTTSEPSSGSSPSSRNARPPGNSISPELSCCSLRSRSLANRSNVLRFAPLSLTSVPSFN